jgi:hypothetical protein
MPLRRLSLANAHTGETFDGPPSPLVQVQLRTGPVSMWKKLECGYQPTPARSRRRAIPAASFRAGSRISSARP